jgi:four helix bundle protein
MAKIEKFEDIIAWQKARVVVNDIYNITSNGKYHKDFALIDQTNRAAISIMLNIVEGFGRKSRKEFNQFLTFAHGSTSELQSALYIAHDRRYIEKDELTLLYNKCDEVSRLIMGLIKYLRK